MGAKAGIGVGVTLGILLLLALVAFAFWYGMRFAGVRSKKSGEAPIIEKAELEAGPPLSEEEKKELGRKRASELEGRQIVELAVNDTGLGGVDIPVV